MRSAPQGAVLQHLERAEVLARQYVVHRDEALAQFDVEAAVTEAAGEDSAGGALVAGRDHRLPVGGLLREKRTSLGYVGTGK